MLELLIAHLGGTGSGLWPQRRLAKAASVGLRVDVETQGLGLGILQWCLFIVPAMRDYRSEPSYSAVFPCLGFLVIIMSWLGFWDPI